MTDSYVTPWAHQAFLSMEFPRQEYWSELPFPSPEDLTHPGTEPASPAFQADFLTLSHREAQYTVYLGKSTKIFSIELIGK